MFRAKQRPSADRKGRKLLRKLGNNEIYQLAMYLLDQYRGTCVSCRYSIPPKLLGPESKDELVRVVENAIADTVLKHPVLHVAIVDANSKSPVWAQLETIDLRQHVTWRLNDSEADLDGLLQGLIANEVDATYPEIDTRPGWRIIVVRPQETNLLEILFTYNHPHCDGMSGKIYHESLLKSLNNATRGTDTAKTTDSTTIIRLPDSPPKLPPPVEDICKLPLTIPFILKTMWEEWGPTALTAKPTLARWAPNPSRSSPYKTQVRAFTVEADGALANILLACRQHQTTLTGLLHALMLASVASQLPEDVAPAFASGTTVDMRRHVDSHPPACPCLQPDRTMGNFVTIMTHEFDRGLVGQIRSLLSRSGDEGAGGARKVLSTELLGLIWSAAATVRRDLERRLEMGLRDDIVGVMKLVGDWQQEMASNARRPRRHSWWITGIGVMDGTSKADSGCGDENSWAIQRAQFVLSTETTAAAINISPLTVAGERLCVTGSWQDCLFDVSFGERVMADLEHWLSQLAQGST